MLTVSVGPYGILVTNGVAGWDEGAAGCDEEEDGTEHPQLIAMQTRRISRKTGSFRIKDRVGEGVVILFLSRTGHRTVHGNQS